MVDQITMEHLGEADGIRITCLVCGIERAGNFWDYHFNIDIDGKRFKIKTYTRCACGAIFKIDEVSIGG